MKYRISEVIGAGYKGQKNPKNNLVRVLMLSEANFSVKKKKKNSELSL